MLQIPIKNPKRISIKYIPQEQEAIWLIPDEGSILSSVSVWEWRQQVYFCLECRQLQPEFVIDDGYYSKCTSCAEARSVTV